jgi:hypothetical protein
LRSAFTTDTPYWRAVSLLGVIAIVPSVVLGFGAVAAVGALGVETSTLLPHYHIPNAWYAVSLIVVGLPLLETALLGIGLRLLGFLGLSPFTKSVISALCWALAHAISAPLQFFGVVWSFFVFSRGYLLWRPKSLRQAIGAAWVPHMMQNALAMYLLFLAGGF